MKKLLIGITVCSLLLAACKKSSDDTKDETPDDTTSDGGPYSGKISVFAGSPVLYNSEGILTQYTYPDPQSANAPTKVKLKWEAGKMTFDKTGSPFGPSHISYNRNAGGYCLQSQDDLANTWQYDSINQIRTMNNVTYYWSNQNIDSIHFYGLTKLYQYSSTLETRDFGDKYIPFLPYFSKYFNKNLRTKMIYLNAARDTISISEYTHLFNTAGRVVQETETVKVNGAVQNVVILSYAYYE